MGSLCLSTTEHSCYVTISPCKGFDRGFPFVKLQLFCVYTMSKGDAFNRVCMDVKIVVKIKKRDKKSVTFYVLLGNKMWLID